MIDATLDDLVTFVERPSSEFYALKLLQEPYLGVIYSYGKVSLHEDEANIQLKVKFDFAINEVPDHIIKENLQKDDHFKTYIGDILIKLIEEKVHNDQSAKDNT